jgi:hypothetical protein
LDHVEIRKDLHVPAKGRDARGRLLQRLARQRGFVLARGLQPTACFSTRLELRSITATPRARDPSRRSASTVQVLSVP